VSQPHTAAEILAILDTAAAGYTFPVLDNGRWYLAATRLSLFRSSEDWGLVIEVFGYSVGVGLPDVAVYTFASRLHARSTAADYISQAHFDRYLAENPHNELRFFYHLVKGDWQGDNYTWVADTATAVELRGERIPLPPPDEYWQHGITLKDPPRVRVYELCRYLAATRRDAVLATESERRGNILPEMKQILQLEEWRHPDRIKGELPSATKSFQQLARVLETGDVTAYTPTDPPNTHWRHWPNGGTL
jgi:hypothetical protein